MAYKKSNANGQATMANSEPVVIASDQSAVPVSGTITANIGTVATLATAAKQDTGNTSLASIDGKITAVNTGAVVLAAGTAAFGKLAANSGVDIGDVDITSIAAGDNNIGNVDIASALPAGTNNIGDVDVLTVPADPFGANADAAATAGSTGSVQAKLRLMTSQLDSIKTAVETLDNTVAGSELQVDVLTMPTVTVNSHAVTNAGTFAVQVDGSALTALQKIDDPVLVDDAAFTPATSSVMMSGFQADEASTDSVDEGDAGAARMTLDRKVIVTTQPHTTGGLSIFRSLDLDESEEDVKTSAGCVYGIMVTNTATTTRWLKFYNATAANVTVGTTTPVITWGIPGNTSDDISGLFASGNGITFDTAISVAATTGVADADTGAPAANDVIVNIFYK